MAAWQVEFHIVPQRALASLPSRLTPAILARTDWWADAAFPADWDARLAGVARAGASPSDEHRTWGDAEGNRVDVMLAGGRVQRVTARVDVRKLDSRFGAALLLFVRASGAALVRADGLVLEPTINAFAGALRGSSAFGSFATELKALRLDDD